jgi:hypothetical protein
LIVFIDLLAKQIINPALNTLIGGPSKLFETSGDLIKEAIQRLVDRAIESGDVRPDLDPFRSAAGFRRGLKRCVRTGLAAERKGDSSISSSSVPARLSRSTFLTTNAATGERKCAREG